MSSLVPGFEYDIFISYRQKDNKGEHWVTYFVDALRTELEATFKEEFPFTSMKIPTMDYSKLTTLKKALKGN